MKESLLKSALPHLVALLVFTILSFAYFYPVIEGRKLNAHDTKVFVGSSKEIFDYREKNGSEPLWTNSMFGGMPAFMISVKFPGNLVKHIDSIMRVYKTPVAVLFLSMVGFYIMMLLFRFRPWTALVTAIGYGFTTYIFVSLSAGHNTKVYAMAYMAPVIGSAIYAFRHNAFRGAVLFALFLSLEIMANHFQITYYTFFILLIFGIFELADFIRRKDLISFIRPLGLLSAAALLAVLVNFASLYTTWEYSKESTRGKSDLARADSNDSNGLDKEYITQWSYGVDETLTLLIPNFRGGATKPFSKDSETVKALRKNNMAQAQDKLYSYWGNQPNTSGPVYFGVVILLLFVIGLQILSGREKWWLITAVIVSVVLSWGKNFMPVTSLFIDYFPGYDKFRAVSMTLVVAGLCVPIVAALALREIFCGKIQQEKLVKAIITSAAITGGLALLFFLVPGLAGSFRRPDESSIPDSYKWLTDAMAADRRMMLRSDALRAFVLIGMGASLLWFFIKEKISLQNTLIVLSVLFLIDMIPVNARYLGGANFETARSFEKSFSPGVADREILADKDQFRVLNLTVSPFNDASTSYFHKSIGGYSGAKMKRYQELIEATMTDEINTLITQLRNTSTWEEAQAVMQGLNALNMLNTRYIIISPEAGPLRNNLALGNAWFVDKVTVVENADAELSAVKTIMPATEAVVDKRFATQIPAAVLPGSPDDAITLASYEPNHLTYKSFTSSERVAVLSEIYYPEGWKATVDGKPAEHFRTDYVLRGMVIPAGEHTISFVFDPQSYKTGNRVSLAGSAILFVLLGLAAFSAVRKGKSDE